MKILVLGDVHHPFANWEKLEKVAAVAKREQPDAIIQIGDLYDMYTFSEFTKNPNFMKPEEEELQGRADADKMWRLFKAAVPKAKCYQMGGNHDIRPVKRVAENLPAALHVMKKHLKKLMTFDGVELVKAEHEIDGIVFLHGNEHRGPPGTCARFNQGNTCIGHTHRPCVIYDQNRNGPYWELNVGWLGDAESEAFDYRSQKKLHKMINGYGLIVDGQPRCYTL